MKKLEILRFKLIKSLLLAEKPIKIKKVLSHKDLRGFTLQNIIFDFDGTKRVMIPELLTELRLCERIDYGNISFNGVDLQSIRDFRNFKNLRINPQRVYDKNLSGCIFGDVTFIGDGNMPLKTKENGKRINLKY